MIEPAAADSAMPRAFLHVGGLTLARQQLALALALGCERIACIARGLGPEILTLQHAAEKAGAQFHVVTGPRALLGLVTANDELFALAEGLLAPPAEVMRLLERGPAVLVQPVESGLAAGFERIDIDDASAGAFLVPGRLIDRLADLPSDCDAISSLQRIALQAGIQRRAIGARDGEAPSRWSLVRSEAEAHAIEGGWVREHSSGREGNSPGNWLARKIARRFGPALLHAGNGGRPLAWAAAILGLLGLGAGWFGLVELGLALCGIGWILRQSAEELSQIEREALLTPPPRLAESAIYGFLLDGVLIALIAWTPRALELAFPAEAYFAPAMLFAMLRLVPPATGAGWAVWLEDRALTVTVLAAVFVAGYAALAVPLAAISLAIVGIVWRRPTRLTPA